MSGLNLNIGKNNASDKRESQKNQEEQPIYRGTHMDNKPYAPFASKTKTGNSLFGQSISPGQGSEYFNKLITEAKKIFENDASKDKFDILSFPRETFTNLTFSVIVIVRNNRVALHEDLPLHNFVTAQAWIVEATNEIPRPYQTQTTRGQRGWTVTPTMDDAYNNLLVDFLAERLKEQYNRAGNVRIDLIDPVIIRRSFDISGSNGSERIRTELHSSTTAVETRSHMSVPNMVDYNLLKDMGNSDLQLVVGLSLVGSDVTTDNQGMPIHVDARIDVQAERINNNSHRGVVFNSPDESHAVLSLGALVELIPVDPEFLDENRSGRGRRDFYPEVAWAPRIVATNIEQYKTRTPSGIYTAIASLSELARERAWAQTYRQLRGNSDVTNLRDLGYLNIEANFVADEKNSRFGAPINTAPSQFDDHALGILLDNTVARSPFLAVDCPTTGATAYYTTGLYNLARGSKSARARAKAEMTASLRAATDDLIDDFVDLEAEDLVQDEGELIHLGYWFNEAGEIRDIREIDQYLPIAIRVGKHNPEEIARYVDTWLDNSVSEEQRMATRLTMVQGAASGGVVVTGTALRVTLNNRVINGFVSALEKGKLPMVSRSTGEGDVFRVRRSVSRLGRDGLYRGNGFSRTTRRDDREDRRRGSVDRY